MIALLLAAASPPSVVDAEKAFAARAQREGQWTAFRATATADAIMFLPQASNAQAFLKGRKDPPVSVKWWPIKAWASCDGTLAVTTGGALWPDGKHGWFTTVWKRQPDGGWKWVLDHGDFTDTPRSATAAVPVVKPVGCREVRPVPTPPPPVGKSGYSGMHFESVDRTLRVDANSYPGGHNVSVNLGGINGNAFVLKDEVDAPN